MTEQLQQLARVQRADDHVHQLHVTNTRRAEVREQTRHELDEERLLLLLTRLRTELPYGLKGGTLPQRKYQAGWTLN